MKHTLTFNIEEDYDPSQAGIGLPVILRLGSSETHALAKLDTGASDCIFRRTLGERLGLVIEQGDERIFHTANSSFKAYGHSITLIVAGDGIRRRSLLCGRLCFSTQCAGA